ncbi:DUF1120 domain-containing protein [Burkholderia territorii]|uniref:DUF1120 domain-containing protein n=1 Tax=Burkholderia territorii TaxID=1503055 RepID=UPI000A8A2100|nr:DUF1120 domain-containing protein [Burkholderia territorii]
MNKKLVMAGVISAVVSSGVLAQAASANFGVTGTINPGACGISLPTGGGVADYGTLSTATVRGYTVYNGGGTPAYVFGNKFIPITVTCSAPTRAELSFVDNKSGQRLSLDQYDADRYGVSDGVGGVVAIGAYTLFLSSTLLDGVAAAGYLTAPTGTTAWSSTAIGGVPASVAAPGYAVGFIKTAGNIAPDTFTTMSGNLGVTLYVDQAYVNSATNVISLQGSGTVTLQYL